LPPINRAVSNEDIDHNKIDWISVNAYIKKYPTTEFDDLDDYIRDNFMLYEDEDGHYDRDSKLYATMTNGDVINYDVKTKKIKFIENICYPKKTVQEYIRREHLDEHDQTPYSPPLNEKHNHMDLYHSYF